MSEKKGKYLIKKVKFGSVEFTLFSLDGLTWSSKKEELEDIKERHERQRQSLMEDTKDYLKREKEKGLRVEDEETEDKGYSPHRRKRTASDVDEDLEALDLHEVDESAKEEDSVAPERAGRKRGRPSRALQAVIGKRKPLKEKADTIEKPAKLKALKTEKGAVSKKLIPALAAKGTSKITKTEQKKKKEQKKGAIKSPLKAKGKASKAVAPKTKKKEKVKPKTSVKKSTKPSSTAKKTPTKGAKEKVKKGRKK